MISLPPLDCLRFFEAAAARLRSFAHAGNELGAAIGRPMLIAHELERRILVPLFDRQAEATERCCLITTAASRQRPELRADSRAK